MRLRATVAGAGQAVQEGVVCQSESSDVMVEATGTIEYGASVVLEAIKNQKHIILTFHPI